MSKADKRQLIAALVVLAVGIVIGVSIENFFISFVVFIPFALASYLIMPFDHDAL